ncbi:MAG: sodium/solute symporter [Spirochaetota bacterium]
MNIDIAILFIYLIAINLIGIKFSGFKNINEYFLGGKSIPWILICISIVATETSSLTFISIPGVSYTTDMGFLQVAFGLLIGRILVAVILIPKYFEGNFETVYQFIQARFGISSRKVIAIVFHVTRLLADSTRLFVTAIPLTLLIGWDYKLSICVIGIATFIYTYYGGLKAIVVTDAVQFFLYIVCVFIGIYVISDVLSLSVLSVFAKIPDNSLSIFHSGLQNGFSSLFGSYNIVSGIIGGAFFSFASHGTDHLIVQRILSCRDLGSAKKAMITSGIIIIVQFALFLLLGLFIKVLMADKHFDKSDMIVPYFIINYLPAGFKGIMLAGIFAAAMSTLSSSINSLSSSTSADLLGLSKKDISDAEKVKISRLISLIWTIVIIAISILFNYSSKPLVVVALSIASVTYGGMMGIFLLGRFFAGFSEWAAIAGMLTSIFANLFILFATDIFWLWYVTIGFAISFGSGFLFSRIINIRKNSCI